MSKWNLSLSTLLSTAADITCLIQNDLSVEILMHIASSQFTVRRHFLCRVFPKQKNRAALLQKLLHPEIFHHKRLLHMEKPYSRKILSHEWTDLQKVCRKFHLLLSASSKSFFVDSHSVKITQSQIKTTIMWLLGTSFSWLYFYIPVTSLREQFQWLETIYLFCIVKSWLKKF